jgi:hypothetical protein
VIGRLPGWLRLVLSIEIARHWRFLAAQRHDGVVSGETAIAVWVRHRRCDHLVWADGPLLRRPELVAGLSVASLDDAVVAVLQDVTPQAAEDLRQVEARTPLRLEEALVLLSLRHPDADLERVVASLPDDGPFWPARKAELFASLRTRGFVQRRTVIPRQRLGVTVGSAGRVWVEPYERDGHSVAGYWRRR